MPRTTAARFASAGIATAIGDFVWATILAYHAGNPLLGPWNAVARVAFGPEFLEPGAVAIAVGLCVHVCVAFGWAGVFLLAEAQWGALRRAVTTRAGLLGVAAIVGPVIWIVMSTVVIPMRTGREPTINGRWFVQLAGHVLFVGVPLVWGTHRR